MANLKYGILVHELPSDYKKYALALFPSKHIEKVKHDKEGLRIYFTNYEIAKEYILRRSIKIQESHYTICPLVTNMTLHGIRKYASQLDIKDKMASYGRVIDIYPVEEIIGEENFETRSVTDDYRVILEVPEVQIDFELLPLQLPGLSDHPFLLSFFCRLCRQNGHMQVQCLESVDCCISQNEEVFQNIRRTKLQSSCPEDSCSENTQVRVRRPSNKKKDLRFSKDMTSIKMNPEKGQKKQINSNDKPNDIVGYNQDERKNVRTNGCFSLESQNTDCDEKHLKEDLSSQISIQTVQSNMKHGISYDKSKPAKHKHQSKSSDEDIWSRIIPPKFHPVKTKSLLLAVYKTKLLDIPQKVQWKLQEILKWNYSRGYKYLKGNARKFIKWLDRYLADVSHMKTQEGHAEGEHAYQPQNTTDDKIYDNKEKKKSRGVLSLCPEIEKIVLKTPGVLDPVLMRNFLNQVRGRRKQVEIAALFEKDFLALSNQLNEVEISYYHYGKRGTREDRDIDFIRRLRNRLMQENAPKKERSSPSEQSSFKKQSNSKMILSQKCNSKTPRHVNYDSLDVAQTSILQMANGKYPNELRKYSRRKNLPGRGWPSGTPKSATEVCSEKYSKKKFLSNFQMNSSYDGHCFSRSSTEREYPKDFRQIDMKGVPTESQSKRILNDKKPSRNGDDPKPDFKSNFSIYDYRCTSNLTSTNYDSDWSRRASNKQSNYTLQYSTTNDFPPHYKQNFHLGNITTELSDVNIQSNSAEERPEVAKNDLREVMACVRRSNSNNVLPEISKEDLRQILSSVQYTEYL